MQLRCSTAQAVLSLWQLDDLRDDISCRCIQASTATMCRPQVILSLRPHSSQPLTVAAAEVRISGYARFGAQWNEGTAAVAGIAAVQGTHTADSAAVVNDYTDEGLVAGDPVTAHHTLILQDNLAWYEEDLADQTDGIIFDRAEAAGLNDGNDHGIVDAASFAAAYAAAEAAQDAAAIADLNELAAEVAADVADYDAGDVADAAAQLAAAAGVHCCCSYPLLVLRCYRRCVALYASSWTLRPPLMQALA
jgi:hypothetical protein